MKTIQEILEEKKDSILGLEKFLYANPEIEMEEYKAKEKFIELLEKEGDEVDGGVRGVGGDMLLAGPAQADHAGAEAAGSVLRCC